jgi:hypothetical protein
MLLGLVSRETVVGGELAGIAGSSRYTVACGDPDASLMASIVVAA